VDKLSINNEMAQLDQKNRAFYDELTAEEKKKFSNFLMIRYGSSIDAGNNPRDKLIQQYYLQSCNENLNKHFFAVIQNYNGYVPRQLVQMTVIKDILGLLLRKKKQE
jgi:hypothetical protein